MQNCIAQWDVLFRIKRMSKLLPAYMTDIDVPLTGIRWRLETALFRIALLESMSRELMSGITDNFAGSRLEIMASPTEIPIVPPTILIKTLQYTRSVNAS